jgi:hypothetical protein
VAVDVKKKAKSVSPAKGESAGVAAGPSRESSRSPSVTPPPPPSRPRKKRGGSPRRKRKRDSKVHERSSKRTKAVGGNVEPNNCAQSGAPEVSDSSQITENGMVRR